MNKISVVVNTLNEEKTLGRVLKSVQWADEIIVCDMHSEDNSVKLAKKMGAKVIFHKKLPFVEPARNFAISKASGDWILILDPDEEIPQALAKKIREFISKPIVSEYIRIPRKNLIFGKWMKASMWWPDYNIRLFKKGKVTWSDRIHIPPTALGEGVDLSLEEDLAIIHYHYTNISQYLTRLDRYTTIQANNLSEDGYKFIWSDLISKPLSEFMGRYFANRGFEDGLHGLALCLLQGFSHLVVYVKVWELEKFQEKSLTLTEVKDETKKAGVEINWWFKYGNLSKNPFKKILQKIGNSLS